MFYIVQFLTKIISKLINLLKLGSGNAYTGLVGLKLYPNLFTSPQIKQIKKFIFITGTNGKTTTSKLITHFLEKSGHVVITNRSGGNMLNGIASAIFLQLKKTGADFGVFEIDEFVLPKIIDLINPDILIITNLSRDQLDRYGEIDIILDRWKFFFPKMSADSTLVLDKNQPIFSELASVFPGKIVYFDDSIQLLSNTFLVGHFNAKNINAACLACEALGLSRADLLINLRTFDYAYGRGEVIKSKDKYFKLLLSKNPGSLNTNLETCIKGEIIYDSILFVLNDDVRDGRDVSWIYDVEPQLLEHVCENKMVYVSGNRYLDMAVRLKYAHVDIRDDRINESLSQITKTIFKSVSKNILVLPNYTAMLNFRKILTGKGIL